MYNILTLAIQEKSPLIQIVYLHIRAVNISMRTPSEICRKHEVIVLLNTVIRAGDFDFVPYCHRATPILNRSVKNKSHLPSRLIVLSSRFLFPLLRPLFNDHLVYLVLIIQIP